MDSSKKGKILFGTDGWRAVMGEGYTIANVERIVAGIMAVLQKKNVLDRPVYIGYDSRFLSETFAAAAAQFVSRFGARAILADRPCPTPAISFAVAGQKGAGGIVITSSHNPPEWNGVKFKTPEGSSSSPELTREFEAAIPEQVKALPSAATVVEFFNPKNDYLSGLLAKVSLKNQPFSKRLHVVIDCMHGSGAGYLADALASLGIAATEIHSNRDPLFGGHAPEPLPQFSGELTQAIAQTRAAHPDALVAGILFDGDADRIAAMDENGRFLDTHRVFLLLLDHLAARRKLTGKVVKTFNVSQKVLNYAQAAGLPVAEVAIGFKHIAALMMSENVLIGGEESGGIGVQGHLPERDATYNALLLLEGIAQSGEPFGVQLDRLESKTGRFEYRRLDLHFEGAQGRNAVAALTKNPPKKMEGVDVVRLETLDGLKLWGSDSSWLLFRASGTEPVVRLYAEAANQNRLSELLAWAKSVIVSV